MVPTPLRPDEEVVGAFIPITLAGKDYRLAELPRRANREFQRHLTSEVRSRLDAIGPLESVDEVMDAMAEASDLWLDLVLEYDRMGAKVWAEVLGNDQKPVLPDREWLDSRATDGDCYRALKKVTGAVYPLAPDLLSLIPELRGALLTSVSKGVAAATIALATSPSMSSAPLSTDGSPTTSNADSPSPSSPDSSTPPSPVAAKPRKRRSTRSRSA